MPNSEKDFIREEVCRLLSACYYEPENAFLEENVFMRLADGLKLLQPDCAEIAEKMEASFREDGMEKLLLDYSQLFLGPFDIQAKPYGSVYLDGEKVVMGKSTIELQKLYLRGGFELAEDFKEMPDHIAAELEFLYLMIFKENEARQTGDSAQQDQLSELKREFLDNHLGRWLFSFTAAIGKGAETIFYQQLALLTETVVRLEMEVTQAGCAA